MDRRTAIATILLGFMPGCAQDNSERIKRTESPTQRPHTATDTQTSNTRTTNEAESQTAQSQYQPINPSVSVPSDDCTAEPVPRPTVTPTDADLSAKPYPSYPSSVERDRLVAFARTFEAAYRWNEFLATTRADRVGDLRVEPSVVRVRRATDGIVVGVNTKTVVSTGTVTAETVTPHPYYRATRGAWYYLTEHGAVRSGLSARAGNIEQTTTPTFENATVVACV